MNHRPRALTRLFGAAMLPAITLGLGVMGASIVPAAANSSGSGSGCQLNSAGGKIQHVIEIQFDNTHFTRDNPNVPSDLEQMPNLLNFIKGNGTLLTNHHTPLISHTADDILTTITGVYGDRHGVPIANSFRYFNPDGTSNLGVSFAYWTDPIFDPTTSAATDTKPNMLSADGKNAPAPWVPFTRAGCNVGGIGTANIELENIATDIPTVFGSGSPQAMEVKNNPNQAFTDFVGIAVHCAAGNTLCSAGNGGSTDALPDEPGGYSGFNALFGASSVAPAINNGQPMTDINGNTIMNPVSNSPGFPGFDGMSAAVSLGYVAAMQEHGVPVTYAYISDAHDKHPSGPAYGPGEAGYVAALTSYDNAFGTFFQRLANDGIDQSNTLFVFTSDEGDHFVGGTPTPAGCDGVTTPCNYSHVNCPSATVPTCPSDNVGELNANMAGLLATEQQNTTPLKVHADDAPTVYITGNPSSTDPTTRGLEHAMGALTAPNFYTGQTAEPLTRALADPVEMKILHMITADPARTPTFTWFADPAYFLFAGAPNCNKPCVQEQFGFAWNHGDFQKEIVTTWLGLVGPGVRHEGQTHDVWSDHTDVRPTILALTGLQDDYASQGRVLTEVLKGSALPRSLRGETFTELASAYKAINAPVGPFGLDTLKASTTAIEGNDATYSDLEGKLQALGAQRDAVAGQMLDRLNGAAFNGQAIREGQAERLIEQADQILERAAELAGGEGESGGD